MQMKGKVNNNYKKSYNKTQYIYIYLHFFLSLSILYN